MRMTASMRPRRIRRGEPAQRRRQSITVDTLQCGHGEFAVENEANADAAMAASSFNAATANSPWRTSRAGAELHRDTDASMRPRRIRRGERGQRCECRPLPAGFNAATANRRGEQRRVDCSSESYERFNAATAIRRGERRAGRRLDSRLTALQCGHGECRGERAWSAS